MWNLEVGKKQNREVLGGLRGDVGVSSVNSSPVCLAESLLQHLVFFALGCLP